ncbi:MAG: cell division ATP-binding protein FtsE [Bacteroidetes bacterium]|nr:cell division ATP-binding protein FtsE [Bacteroidota bacterium]MCW5897490.1 cell division ATP-binding protein FtsE [Bacteroidota bacterium]
MIQFSNVTAAFDGHNVLEDVSVQINPGEFVFVVGQTGSGKSTLLRLMYMDVMPEKGAVIVGKYNSQAIQKKEKPYLRRTLGIVFQDFRLMEDRSVFENVAFTLHVTGTPRKDIKKSVLRALADVGLSHQRNKMALELSGGEQQRVVIARALVNDPLFLLADEPTGNLDPTTSWDILQLLKTINTRGTAIIMATHNHDLVKRMNARVIEIRDGKLFEVKDF